MRRLRPTALLAAAALAISAGPFVSAHAAEGTPQPAGGWKVTLLTGDVVRVRNVPGRPPQVSVEPGAGRRTVSFFKEVRPDGDVRVLPLDMAPLVGRVLDPALFDVTALIKDGDDDAHRTDLPLIVQGGGTRALAAPAHHTLTSLGAVAVRRPKHQPMRATSASADFAGVRHVWLDRQVKAAATQDQLDHNLVQIGAPSAWRAGADGSGVKVAVLDTGVDATHPDLQGRIAAQQNFSTSPDTVDRFGHGTHVAATIAGSGAAAHGQRRGVAFDSRLLIGKVLGDDGYGRDSDVIAGMEWAAPQAKIVSMSLGGLVDPNGPDPTSDALNALTTKYGTLFVVAAGNSGPGVGTVGSPGVAASALTVGAVDGGDRTAVFSSRGGPQPKPEIAAPGVDVIAARAKGTAMGHPIDGLYTAASGTSMATPQVAGAAALLLQRHPSWTWTQLKSALVSSAHATPMADVYQVGGGRLDVAAAVTDQVTAAQPTAAFGDVAHASAPVTRPLAWTNTGSRPVTVQAVIHLDDHTGHDASRALAISPTRVVIPAGGSGSATLTLDPGKLRNAGLYSGTLVAGQARTPITLFHEPVTHTLTLKATALPGTPAGHLGAYASIVNVDDPDLPVPYGTFDANGVATVQVPEGHYSVLGTVTDGGGAKQAFQQPRSAFVGAPELNVDHDVVLSLDASRAMPVQASAPGATATQATGLEVERGARGQMWSVDLSAWDSPTPLVFSTPTEGVRLGSLRTYGWYRLTGKNLVYDLMHDFGSRVPASASYQVTAAELPKLARIDEAFHGIGGDTRPFMETRYGQTPAGFLASQSNSDAPAGSRWTSFISTEPGEVWASEASPALLGQGTWVIETPATRLDPGSRQTADWGRQPFRPGPVSATATSPSFCLPQPTARSRGSIHVELVDLQDVTDGFDCLTDFDGWNKVTSRSMRLYAGDHEVGSTGRQIGDFTVPATSGTYRLAYDLDYSKALPVSTTTSTQWTFRSAPPADRNGSVPVPLLLVDYNLPLDLFGHPSGDTATFTVFRVKGSAPANAASLKLWTSTDDGRTWTSTSVRDLGAGRYSAVLPHLEKGQSLSLRVDAQDTGGGRIQQTVTRAYTAN